MKTIEEITQALKNRNLYVTHEYGAYFICCGPPEYNNVLGKCKNGKFIPHLEDWESEKDFQLDPRDAELINELVLYTVSK